MSVTAMATEGKIGDMKLPVVSPPRTTVRQLMGLYLVVTATVALAWLFGALGFSFMWVFFMIGCLFVVWKSRLKEIVDKNVDWHKEYLYRKRALRQEETAEWLNFLFNRWWVFSACTIEDLVKKRINERLLSVKPSFVDKIDLVAFTFGDSTPSIKNVKVFECTDGVPGFTPASWANVIQPPLGLDKMSQYQVVLQADMASRCEDFRMVFRGRLGTGKVGLDFDVAVEGMHVTGTLQIVLHMCMEVPFPHIVKASVSFKELPEVWFNICVLKAIQMMEIPLLKSWIHVNLMEGITKAMVDPGKIDIPVAKVGPVMARRTGAGKPSKTLAEGVLTIFIKGTPGLEAGEDVCYTRLRIGNSRRQTHEVPATHTWEDVCSFFVYDLSREKLQVKSKCKRLLTTVTLEQHVLDLNSFPFQVRKIVDHEIINKDGSKLNLQMDYSALSPIDLTDPVAVNVIQPAGVLYVCVHSATNLLASDATGSSDPYCVVFCDRRRVLTTPYVIQNRNPLWDSHAEFFVKDFSQCHLSFYVFDWDGSSTIEDDFLGSTNLTLSQQEPVIINRMMTLGYNKGNEGHVENQQLGQITVSVIFRPAPSVERSERHRLASSETNNNFLYVEDMVSPGTFWKPGQGQSSEGQDEQAVPRCASNVHPSVGISDEIMENKIYVDLTIVQAEDLVAMDRNGYSDPFCEVKMKDKRLFKTSVKKKTLNPKWEESVTFEIAEDSGMLEIFVYDKDIIRDDFIGSVLLTLDKLKELSLKGTSDWFDLQRTKSGRLQLACSVTTKDTVKAKTSQSKQRLSQGSTRHRGPSGDASLLSSGQRQTSLENDVFIPDVHSPIKPSQSLANTQQTSELSENKDVIIVKRQPKTSTPMPTPMKDTMKGMQRSASDVDLEMKTSATRKSRSDSLNSFAAFNGVESHSTAESEPNQHKLSPPEQTELSANDTESGWGEKVFSVSGKVMSVQGLQFREGHIYCKVRVQSSPGHHRLRLRSGIRVVAKSQLTPAAKPVFNLPFEVDRGIGTSPDTLLIFDIKGEKKDHLATKGFTLRSIFDGFGNDKIQKVLKLENGLEVEIFLQHNLRDPNISHRPSGKLSAIRRSFHKEKYS